MARIHYEPRDVRAICELTRAKGFREAAEALAITPSALSRRVAKLEEAVGALLVNRTTRSMALTPLGRRLAARCEPLLNALDDSIDESARMARGMEGQLAVGSISSVSSSLLAPVVASFRQRYPNLRVILREANTFGIGAAVLHQEIDFGIATAPGPRGELHAELVATDPMVLACAPDSPFAKKRTLRWADIAQERLMGYMPSSSVRQMVDGALAKAGVELLWFDEVDTLSSLIAYLRTGQFTAVVPKVIASQLGGLAVVPLTRPRLDRRIYLVRRHDAALTPPAQVFWNEVRKQLKSALAG